MECIEIDRLAREDYGLSAEKLMESAGQLSASEILDRCQKNKISSVMILCGPGNNGGDGLVVARHLLSEGLNVQIFISSALESDLIKLQKQRLKNLEISFFKLEKVKTFKNFKEKTMIVDALFGIGLARRVGGIYQEVIKWINTAGQPVISLDTPSGLNVDTGHPWFLAVRADQTLTFGLAKPGFYLRRGPEHVGELKVLSIGFPQSLLREQARTHFLITESWVREQLPERQATDNKSHHGNLLVLAGSEGFWGAAQLVSLAAYRMGAGYVTWGLEVSKKRGAFSSVPEMLTQSVEDPHLLNKKTAVAIGPGLGTGGSTKKLLEDLKKTQLPVVVDADAFTVCVEESLFPLPEDWVLTPHSGELGRFFNIKGVEIDKDPCFYAMEASQKMGCLVLLKGFYSVLAWAGQCWIIPTGNSGLAKAGTGDVLTGFIGALLARALPSFSAVSAATFIHGLLAEEWLLQGKDRDSLMARDLVEELPFVLKKLKDTHEKKL